MITEIFKDSLADGAAKVLTATLPFITLGMLGNEWMAYISCAIGIIAIVVLAVSFFHRAQRPHKSKESGAA